MAQSVPANEKLPGPHGVHAEAPICPCVEVPAGHAAQVMFMPCVFTGHTLQWVEPANDAAVPGAQGAHAVAPVAEEYVPVRHSLHTDTPSSLLYVPGAHVRQPTPPENGNAGSTSTVGGCHRLASTSAISRATSSAVALALGSGS